MARGPWRRTRSGRLSDGHLAGLGDVLRDVLCGGDARLPLGNGVSRTDVAGHTGRDLLRRRDPFRTENLFGDGLGPLTRLRQRHVRRAGLVRIAAGLRKHDPSQPRIDPAEHVRDGAAPLGPGVGSSRSAVFGTVLPAGPWCAHPWVRHATSTGERMSRRVVAAGRHNWPDGPTGIMIGETQASISTGALPSARASSHHACKSSGLLARSPSTTSLDRRGRRYSVRDPSRRYLDLPPFR